MNGITITQSEWQNIPCKEENSEYSMWRKKFLMARCLAFCIAVYKITDISMVH